LEKQPQAATKGLQVSREVPLTETEQVAKKRLAEAPQVTAKDLREREIQPQVFDQISAQAAPLTEPYNPGEINFTRDSEQIARSELDGRINSVGQRATSSQQLGRNIQDDINLSLDAAREEYAPLYRQAEQASQFIYHVPVDTAGVASRILQSIERISTRPEGYGATIRAIESALEDAGFQIRRDEAGRFVEAISTREVPTDNLIELGRRLNGIIDYEGLAFDVKDRLRPIARAVKRDVRRALEASPEALTAYELAEEAHANTARRFGRDSLKKIRGEQSTEKIVKMLDSPTVLQDLRNTVTPQQMEQIEREIIEKLNTMPHEKARDYYREISGQLSAENRALARDIVHSKNPLNPMAKRRQIQNAIVEDLSNAFSTGTRPEKTLRLWKTPEGQRVVRDAFRGSPNASRVERYLQDQSFRDLTESFLSADGKVDFKKFNDLMKDPAMIENIRRLGGEDAVRFFKALQIRQKQLQRNLDFVQKLSRKKEVSKGKFEPEQATGEGKERLKKLVRKDYPMKAMWDDLMESLSINTKAALSVFGLMRFGFIKSVQAYLAQKLFYRFLTSKRARELFIEAAKPTKNPVAFMEILKELDKALSQQDENEVEINS
jgi:hypothetical protein